MKQCLVPPPGWRCTRAAGHEGPCAALPVQSNPPHRCYVCMEPSTYAFLFRWYCTNHWQRLSRRLKL